MTSYWKALSLSYYYGAINGVDLVQLELFWIIFPLFSSYTLLYARRSSQQIHVFWKKKSFFNLKKICVSFTQWISYKMFWIIS